MCLIFAILRFVPSEIITLYNNDRRQSESEESQDDDISILSTQKVGGIGIDDEDMSDSGYSDDDEDNGESLHSSEDNEEEIDTEDNQSSSPNEDEPDPEALSKAERKRRKKEKKRRKKEKKKRKKERKEKRRREKEAKKKSKKHKEKNSASMGEGLTHSHSKDNSHNSNNVSLDISRTSRSNSKAKLEEDGEGNGSNSKDPNGRHSQNVSDNDISIKKRSTITGKIKKIGQKIKKIGKDKDGDKDKDDIDRLDNEKIMKIEEERGQYKIRPNPLNKTSTIKFKDMFKGKTKNKHNIHSHHNRDDSHISVDYSKVLGKEEEIFAGRADRSQTTISHDENEKKKSLEFYVFFVHDIIVLYALYKQRKNWD